MHHDGALYLASNKILIIQLVIYRGKDQVFYCKQSNTNGSECVHTHTHTYVT